MSAKPEFRGILGKIYMRVSQGWIVFGCLIWGLLFGWEAGHPIAISSFMAVHCVIAVANLRHGAPQMAVAWMLWAAVSVGVAIAASSFFELAFVAALSAGSATSWGIMHGIAMLDRA